MIFPTPADLLVDQQGRPYFLWDCDVTLDEFQAGLAGSDPAVRDYLLAKLMRQAKPDDVFRFVTLAVVEDAWPRVSAHLGRSRPFWEWLLGRWREQAARDGSA